MKLLGSLIALAALAFACAYYGSPYYAVWRLEQASKALDAGAVAGFVDFPAVKANLSPRLAAILRARIEAGKKRPDSLVDQIGKMIAPIFAGRPTDALVTPEAVAVMVKTGAPPAYTNPFRPQREPDSAHPGEPYTLSEGYVERDMDEFQAIVGNRLKVQRRGVKLQLLRRGFFSWRVTSLDLVATDPDAKSAAGSGPAS